CYRAELVLGMTTDTQDADGEVLTECAVNCTEDEIREAIMSFVGEIEQIPPMYSAIKQNGKKLYELARQGIEVERKKRKVTINSIDILKIDVERVTIDVSCSKGTYIRTLCEDIGLKLHVGAYMNTLRRTKTGPFTIEDSYTLKELEVLKEKGQLESVLISVDRMFEEYPKILLNPKQVKSITNGVQMSYNGTQGQSYRLYDEKGKFLCISKMQDGKLKLEKAFWN
ncbi:MAG: tRNA pseudouridine(55) synthase TruB, partial [Clostridia bacterium]|nr:tRNA pseudouridine(55) synthase TruB [Clostridia bacterium]